MREYSVVPKIGYCKWLPFGAIICQLMAIGVGIIGYFFTSAGYILAVLYQLGVFYYIGLFMSDRHYRVHVSASTITVRSVFNKAKTYGIDTVRWKILRIPWYDSYYILLYSSRRIPVAMVKPLWENALELIRFPHLGELSEAEIGYLKFLKKMGLLLVDIKRIKKR